MSGRARHDVIVVGAGFCGLSAARALVAAGLDVVVVEARDTVGGRVRSQMNGLGERVDTGGQFLCDDMPELLALARAHGKTLKPSFVDGDFVAQPPLPADEADAIYDGSMAIRARMNRIDPHDPAIKGLSVAVWLDAQRDTPGGKAAFRSMIEGLWCLALERLPLWHLVDNDRRITNDAPELQYFLAETLHSLAEDVSRDLASRIRLGTQVVGVQHRSAGVVVSTEKGVLEARAAIVALPPMVASRITFSPALPERLSHALSVWESGAVIKALIRYEKPFWRDRGQSGMVMWREPPSLFAFDASPDSDHATLAFFAGGPTALKLRERDDARAFILARLVAALGQPAGEPTDLLMLDWTQDAHSGGAYSDLVVDMAATDAEEVLRQGAPCIVFASSELSPSFPGYVEGAIVAGRAAAVRARDELDRQASPPR